MDGLRFDGPERVLAPEGLDKEPTIGKAILWPYPKADGPMGKRLGKVVYEGPQSWTAVGRNWGTRYYGVAVQDYEDGPDSSFSIRRHVTIACEGFGPPRNLAAPDVPQYAPEQPTPVTTAPRTQEPPMNPPLVQTPQEALLASLQGGRQDPLGAALMFLLNQMAQGQGQQTNDLRELVRRLVASVDEMAAEVKQLRQQVARQQEEHQAEAARAVRNEELLLKLGA